MTSNRAARRGEIAQCVGDRGEQPEPRELAVGIGHGRVDHIRAERAQQLRPRPEGRRTGFGPARDAPCIYSGIAREADRLLCESGLADPGFAPDEEQSAPTFEQRAEVRSQLSDLTISTDEHTRAL